MDKPELATALDAWAADAVATLLAEAVDNLIFAFSAQVSEVAALPED